VRNVIILGSGPAGLTAALYTARANLSPLVIAGREIGGQISITTDVENYPGFPEGLTGPELAERMQEQAKRFGAEILLEEATAVNLRQHPFQVKTPGHEYEAKSLIIATGATPRKLGVRGERELTGRGVSYCATCDGIFFTGKEVVVVGGGDSAVEEGVFLTKFATKVTLIHRRDRLRASQILQDRARRNERMNFLWNTIVTEIIGDVSVQAVRVKNLKTGEEAVLPTGGVFVYIGHVPNTSLFHGQVELDEQGYIVTDRRTHTSVEGVFAAGEVQDPVFRQIVTSAGFGCMAAKEAEKFLAHLEDRQAG